MAEQLLEAGGVRLCVQAFGDSAGPPVLLIAGAAQSMVWWEDEFCDRIASGGHQVLRYDHRDTGRSSASPAGRPDYTAADLTLDPIRILDALDLATAHFVGLSTGGGITQELAATHPQRVCSVTLIETSPAASVPEVLPGPTPPAAASFANPPPAPDWSDREAVIRYRVDIERPFAGGLGFDEERVRRLAGLEVDRTDNMAAALRNHFLVIEDDAWPDGVGLADITAPALVLHGTDDPLFPLQHGRVLAARLPDARLVELPGVGHQQPPPERWDLAIPAILEHLARH